MESNLITVKLKDELLSDLLSTGSMNGLINIYTQAKEFNANPDIVEAIYDHFEELGFISQTKCIGGDILLNIKVKAHDFFNHGGFLAQEELLKANIQKLNDELELLSKNLSPDMSEKASLLSGIAANIATALGLFLSK